MERRIFPEGNDRLGRPYADLRWSRFKNFAPAEMFVVVGEHVFPFLRTLGGDDSTYAHHMKDARFTIPTPSLLAKVVDLLDEVPMEDRDTKGDLYEYMLGKIASAGQNGQFRTPRHIIRLMVELTAPNSKDVICDPASGTCGFLVAAGEYLRDRHPEILRDDQARRHFHHEMFHGFDFDNTMLRIGSMNMLLHGVGDVATDRVQALFSRRGSTSVLSCDNPTVSTFITAFQMRASELGRSYYRRRCPQLARECSRRNHRLRAGSPLGIALDIFQQLPIGGYRALSAVSS